MTKKKLTYTIFFNSIILLFLLLYASWDFINRSGANESIIVYVDNIKLYTNFNMAKDLEKLNDIKISSQKKKLDSLYTLHQIYKENKNSVLSSKLEEELRKEDQKLKNLVEYVLNDANEKIWSRLDTYIKSYGQENNFRIIIGTQGKGNVMYAKPESDITEGLILYVNSKYEGN